MVAIPFAWFAPATLPGPILASRRLAPDARHARQESGGLWQLESLSVADWEEIQDYLMNGKSNEWADEGNNSIPCPRWSLSCGEEEKEAMNQ
jgi:hypothetical protein